MRSGIHGLEARNVGACHSHLSISWGSVVSTGPLFPSAWNSNCGQLPRLACVCVDTLGPGVQHGSRTKAWPDIQAQNARAKVKKSDRQTDIVVYMSNRGPPVSSLVMATTSWMLALGLGKHRAWCSDWGRGPRRGARPLPMCGDGPENIRKRPLCIPLSRSHTGGSLQLPSASTAQLHTAPWGPQDLRWPGHWGTDLRDSMSLKALRQAWPCLRQGGTQK